MTAPELSTFLARIPVLAGASGHGAKRLGGLTNVNYLINHDGSRYVVRIAGDGTAEYIDRRAEEVAARAAAAAGVNADVIFFDATDGLMVTRFVDGAVTMSPARFSDRSAVARAGRTLRRLHTQSAPFATDFELFAVMDDFSRLLASKHAQLPDGIDDVVPQTDATRRALERGARLLVPSHCDPLCENFLDRGDRMFLIDYEYAGNHDPMWDLGDLSVEGEFDSAQDGVLLRSYFDGDPPADEVGRMVAYKAMCDLLWALWGVLQHVNGNPVEDFWSYACGRFERCRALMSSPDYPEYVRAITA